jgi:hypothetical protein
VVTTDAKATTPLVASAINVLVPPDEPSDTLRRLRRESPDGAASSEELVRLIAQRLWRAWGEALGPLDVRPATFRRWIAEADREIGLWARGDRPWVQVIDGIRGRVWRRALDGSTAGDTPDS